MLPHQAAGPCGPRRRATMAASTPRSSAGVFARCLLGCRGTARHRPALRGTASGPDVYEPAAGDILRHAPASGICQSSGLLIRGPKAAGQPRRGGAARRRGGGLNTIGRREARPARYMGGTREVRRRYPGGTSRRLSHRFPYRRTRRCHHGTNACRHRTARTSRMLDTGNGLANCHRHRGLSPEVSVTQHLGRSVAPAQAGRARDTTLPTSSGRPFAGQDERWSETGRPSGRSLSPRRFR
jgi:hypothetical protein